MQWRRYEEPTSPFSASPSLRQKVRSMNCFSCCFRGADGGKDPPAVEPSLIRSSSMWIQAKAGEIPEIKERFNGLIARIGKASRRQNGDFRYDPLSYALNFDEGGEDETEVGEEFQYRNFSSRLPPSPPQPAVNIAGR
ncbi:hypothetical protein AXF42_Ash018716 [Apostasia shenzhenica]|uniref:Uncharacterized protein n=1 Tax=Apostasia shenzhenica TaxID=1088818 RepID=A0A2H9ZZQ9_9ASPA|nr:hypothetical protein AXF42_Ash018716 [Apostasia shenzhenica]